MKTEQVILVNERDEETGLMEKMEAHEKGLLHRAFSVFVFNDKNEMLLQRRAMTKYHSAGLWTNACCSHPRPGEKNEEAANRRLLEEMGFSIPLQKKFSFIYKAELENKLTEHELDHVFSGIYNGDVKPDAEEVMEWAWKNVADIKEEIKIQPGQFTEWFKLILKDQQVNLYPTPRTE
ncbi:MAG: isopentenyl-diphosphate Delta-isomerase [Bacteroidia bacterium]|nr:isopentenyl-diphosphate Delta-isomerase [Bacteroidia bacterium]